MPAKAKRPDPIASPSLKMAIAAAQESNLAKNAKKRLVKKGGKLGVVGKIAKGVGKVAKFAGKVVGKAAKLEKIVTTPGGIESALLKKGAKMAAGKQMKKLSAGGKAAGAVLPALAAGKALHGLAGQAMKVGRAAY